MRRKGGALARKGVSEHGSGVRTELAFQALLEVALELRGPATGLWFPYGLRPDFLFSDDWLRGRQSHARLDDGFDDQRGQLLSMAGASRVSAEGRAFRNLPRLGADAFLD